MNLTLKCISSMPTTTLSHPSTLLTAYPDSFMTTSHVHTSTPTAGLESINGRKKDMQTQTGPADKTF